MKHLKTWKKGRYLGNQSDDSSIKIESKEEEEILRL